MRIFIQGIKKTCSFSNFVLPNCQNFNISYWSLTSGTCKPCATGFVTNYFFADNPTLSYYNPYTCYQVQAGTTDFYSARLNCNNRVPTYGGITTMIIRTNAEYADAERFVDLFGGSYFWVCSLSKIQKFFQ